jgi:hypothetical protein
MAKLPSFAEPFAVPSVSFSDTILSAEGRADAATVVRVAASSGAH